MTVRSVGPKQRAAWLSVAANAVAVLVKFATAFVTGSSAILSEAAHSTGDLTASVIALLSVRAADRPPDPGHPFGHQKFEHVSGVVEGAMIVVAAGAVAVLALSSLGDPIDHGAAGVVVMLGAAIANVLVARRLRMVARETQSAALDADAAHLSADVVTSLGAAAALLLVAATGIRQLDGIVACLIAVFVARTGVGLVVRGARVLVDEAVPEAEVAVIHEVLERSRADGVVGYHRLRARRAGAVRHVDLHLMLDPTMSVSRAHDITDAIEEELETRLGHTDVVIHIEPATHEPEQDSSLL